MRVEPLRERVDAALFGGVKDRLRSLLDLRRTPVGFLEPAGEQLDLAMPVHASDLVDRSALGIGQAGVESLLERAPHRLQVAAPGRVEDALAVVPRRIERIDMGLEPAPACETVAPRNVALGRGKLGVRIVLAKLLVVLLRLVSQMFQAGLCGKRSRMPRRAIGIVGHG